MPRAGAVVDSRLRAPPQGDLLCTRTHILRTGRVPSVRRHIESGRVSHFDAYVARNLADSLPWRAKYLLFGSKVCEPAALPPMMKAAFYLGAALGLWAKNLARNSGGDAFDPLEIGLRSCWPGGDSRLSWMDGYRRAGEQLRVRVEGEKKPLKRRRGGYERIFPEDVHEEAFMRQTLDFQGCIMLLQPKVALAARPRII